MASVKDKRPATKGLGAKQDATQNLSQRDLIERGGRGFEKFIHDAQQDIERASKLHARLRSIGLEGITTREQFRDAVQGSDLTTEAGQKRFVELLALAKDFVPLSPPIEEAVAAAAPTAERVAVDSSRTKEEDQTMSSTTDKDYIDARLNAMAASLDQRLETAAAKSDGRLEVIETRIDGRLASIESSMRASFAEFGAIQSKNNAETLKWIVATGLIIGGLGLGCLTFIANNFTTKQPAQPVAAQAQPAPAVSMPSATKP